MQLRSVVRCVTVCASKVIFLITVSPRLTAWACILVSVVQRDWVYGVVPAGRPPVGEARLATISSLEFRSAPCPLLLRSWRIRGLVSLHLQARPEEVVQGRGAGTPAYPQEAVMHKSDFTGIEVSAKELLVALRRGEQTLPLQSFSHTPAGYRALGPHLARKGRRVRVCMESTGVYGLDLALLLQKHSGLEVMVANPRAVRHFAHALMERSKSDPLDAIVLLEFAARMPFQPWQPPSVTALHWC